MISVNHHDYYASSHSYIITHKVKILGKLKLNDENEDGNVYKFAKKKKRFPVTLNTCSK